MDNVKKAINPIEELHKEFQNITPQEFRNFFFSLVVRGVMMKMRSEEGGVCLNIFDSSKGKVIEGNSFKELYDNWMEHYMVS